MTGTAATTWPKWAAPGSSTAPISTGLPASQPVVVRTSHRTRRLRARAVAAGAFLLVIGGATAGALSALPHSSGAASTAESPATDSSTTAVIVADDGVRQRLSRSTPRNRRIVTAVLSPPVSKNAARTAISATRLAGQAIMTGFDGTSAPATLLSRIRRGEVGGVILFGQNIVSPSQLATLTSSLQAAARQGGNPPLLLAVDQEGGVVRRVAAAPPYVGASVMGHHSDAWIEKQGVASGRSLRTLGVNLNLARRRRRAITKLFSRSRSFGPDPARVAGAVHAFVKGLQHARVAATAKHFPGLGDAPANTDDGIVTVSSSRRDLDRLLAPFKAAIDGGVQLVMVSSAIYPALDPKDRPAIFSPPIVTGLLRDRLHFHGVVITDSMSAPGAHTMNDASNQAISAGVDVLLYADEANSEAAFASLNRVATSDQAFRAELERAYRNTQRLKHWVQRRP